MEHGYFNGTFEIYFTNGDVGEIDIVRASFDTRGAVIYLWTVNGGLYNFQSIMYMIKLRELA